MRRFKIQDLGFRNWILILVLTSCLLPPTSTIGAATPSDLQQQIEQTKKDREVLVVEQKKLQTELDAINKEGQTLGAAVKSLDTTKKKLTTDINITKSKITSTDLTIRSLEKTVGEKEQQIVIHRQAISDTLITLAERDARPLILNLLASVELSDLWKDTNQLAGLNTRLEDEINALRETRKILNQEKVEKEKAKKEQVSLQGQLLGQKSVVEENQKTKTTLLAETKNKEAEYQKILAENLARQKEYDQDIFNLESQLNLNVDTNLIPAPSHGLLTWPFDASYMDFCNAVANVRVLHNSKCVTQRFTYNNGNGSGHNGLDLRAAVGTPVHAIASGVVEGLGNSDDQKNCYSYGRWILIKHNNGLSSIYAHLSASLVKEGQSVSAGDLLGYSGGAFRAYGSGNSQAPHLHLGLLASQGVEIKPFTSGRYLTTGQGCHNVLLPVADPKAYLDPLAYLPSL